MTGSIHTNRHLTRHADLIPDVAYKNNITIVGAGAIGSFLALQLVKMGFDNLYVYDYDEVDIVNMSCQFYRFSDIGKPKAVALRELVFNFTDTDIHTINKAWQKGDALQDIVVNASDSMQVRKQLLNAAIENKSSWFIDARMGPESAMIYAVDLRDKERVASYRKTLYSDEDAVQERCTAKATIYTANLVSGMVSKIIKNITCKQNYPHTTLWSIAANDCEQFS